MNPQLRPGTVILHPEFGAGTIVSNDGDRIEIDFKLRGRKKLVASIAAKAMTVTGFKQLAGPTIPAPVNAINSPKKREPKPQKKKTKAKQELPTPRKSG